MSDSNHGFWAFGQCAHAKVLDEQHARAVADLRTRIAAASTDSEKKALEGELAKVEADYRQTLANIERLLF